ncbi:MAG: serine/threonine-protein kinase, partial [Verrucomicrobiota bacterium]
MSSPAVQPERPSLSDYELIKLIGRGSYGDVWLARGVTGVFRAVKVVWRNRFPDIRPYAREFEGVTRFASISLREPSQLALLHAGRSDDAGFFYYVMELADDAEHGRTVDPETYVPLTLRELHARRGRLPASEVLSLGVAMCRALASLHAANLVHRDIKPSNVVLIGGVPKLADVGLVAAASAGLTFVGTEGFVPPEGPGATTADVFSLGKVLYELATGLDRNDYPRLPPNLAKIADRKELLELNEILIRACEPHPEKRYRDASALLDDLLLLQAGKSVRRLRAIERRLTRALRAAAVLTIFATVAGAGAWIEHRRAADTEKARAALAQRSVYAATVSQAQRAIEREEFGRARRLLAQTKPEGDQPDLRGLEWHVLSFQAQGDPCRVLRERGPAIDRMALSPDGSLLAVHDEDKGLTLYTTATLTEVRRIAGVQRLGGFSADGTWLVGTAATPQGKPQRWAVATGTPAPEATTTLGMRPIGASGNDRMLAVIDARPANPTSRASGRPLEMVLWDFSAGRPIVRLPLDPGNDAEPWEFFRASIRPGSEEILLASVKGRGGQIRSRLTLVRLGAQPSVEHHVLENFLPYVIGD